MFPCLPALAFKTDALVLHFRAAQTPEQLDRVLRAWLELKWTVATQALIGICRSGSPEDVHAVESQLMNVVVQSRTTTEPLSLIYIEVAAYWQAAQRLDSPGILAIANSVTGSVAGLEEAWEFLADADRAHENAEKLLSWISSRNVTRLAAEIPSMHRAEWESWRRRLTWSRSQVRPPRLTGERVGDLFWKPADPSEPEFRVPVRDDPSPPDTQNDTPVREEPAEEA